MLNIRKPNLKTSSDDSFPPIRPRSSDQDPRSREQGARAGEVPAFGFPKRESLVDTAREFLDAFLKAVAGPHAAARN